MDGRIHDIEPIKDRVMFDFIAYLIKKKKTKLPRVPLQEQMSNRVQILVKGSDTDESKQAIDKPDSILIPAKNIHLSPEENGTQPAKMPETNAGRVGDKPIAGTTRDLKHSLSFSNNFSHLIPSGEKREWFVVSASATGKSHEGRLPCQDNHYCAAINAEWGIAISCDGAGSAANSHLGSAYVATELAAKSFKELVTNNGWHKNNTLPSKEQWSWLAREACVNIYTALEQFAGRSQINLNSLACTLIVIIYSPNGLLVTHIGDGRAGYCNKEFEWKSLITPHKGEEANQTVFITSSKWITDPGFVMSGKPVPESNVITEKALAFTALSDGCELHSFECSVMDAANNKWYDPNTPYAKFFNPLVKNLKHMNELNTPPKGANDKWMKFIESGTVGLESEPDDKTMILGINI
jgi:Protein phosphatase 2C